MNKVILTGRFVADPEFRQTQSGIACCRFRIAVNRPYRKDAEQTADFINCVCWRGTAEFVSRYFSKGKAIIVEGRLQSGSYTDNSGNTRYTTDVLVESVEFGESKGSGSSGEQTQAQAEPARTAAQQPTEQTVSQLDLGEFEEILSDGEVPF